MKRIIKEYELRDIIKESVLLYLNETRAIRQWTDQDYLKVNPYQDNASTEDFARWKEADDKFNQEFKPKKKSKHATEKYGKLFSRQQAIVDKVQNELTPILKQRKLKDTGSSTILPSDIERHYKEMSGEHVDFSKMKSYNFLRKKLKSGGVEFGLFGKTFAYGNEKLPEDTMICNITSTFLCPSAIKGECDFKNVCYSNLGVESKPAPVERNLRNEFAWDYIKPKELMKLIFAYIEQAPTRIHKIRISEDGDLRNQEQLEFIDKLAGHLKAKYNIDTAVYTHRQMDFSQCKNLIINMSDRRIKGGTRYFLAVPTSRWETIPEGLSTMIDYQSGKEINSFKCYCDCRKCRFCYQTKEDNGESASPTYVFERLRLRGEKKKKKINTLKKTKK